MRLKELRKAYKKTQSEIAEIINSTQRTYSGYELETSEPTIETLCKLADYYSVSLDYLVGREFINEYIYLSDDEKTMLNIYKKLNDLNKIKIVAQATGMFVAQN